VARGEDGEVSVLLNVCRHRGMEVCRAESGNAAFFRCPYHYWTYGQDGRFIGLPVAKEQMQGDIIPKDELGLRRARVERYVGMIFATWDEQAPTLAEYMGDIKWYLDLMFDRTDEGFVVSGPPQRFLIPANWKCAGEQFAGDGYHTLGLHRSLLELGVLGGAVGMDSAPGMYGVDVSASGHGLRCIPQAETYQAFAGASVDGLSPIDKLRLVPPPGVTPDRVDQLARRFTPGQLRVLADFPPAAGGMFPNSGCINFYSPMPDGKLGVAMGWHSFVPRGPAGFELLNWVFVQRGTEADEELHRRSTIFGAGTTGVVEMDDAEAWPSMQRSARGAIGRRQTLKYQALLGDKKPDDWAGPGHVYGGFSKDDNQWNWWLRWLDFMTGKAW
jgi:nitrite reductase/ring-hydroxylating ferredoxin subunit